MIAAATAIGMSATVSARSAEVQRSARGGPGLSGAIWSSLPDDIHSQFWVMRSNEPTKGLTTVPTQFEQRHIELFHTVTYPQAGTTSIRLFDNQAPAAGICNLNQGRLPSEQPMWLKYIGLSISDITAAGTVSAARSVAFAAATGAAEVALHDVLANGEFSLKVQGQEIFRTRGLHRLLMPGPQIQISQTLATVTHRYIGGPITQVNGLEFPGAYALVPDKTISAEVTFPAALALPANTTPGFTFYLIGEGVVRRTR